MSLRLITSAAFVALGLALMPLAATAQEQAEPALAPEEITDQQLESFAAAALAVNEVGREWARRIQATEDESEVEQMQVQAQEEMAAAVEEEGLTVEEYNAIYAAAESDEEINAEIQSLLQEQQSGG